MTEQTEKTEAPKLKTIFAVRLGVDGARACGPYQAGEIYKVGEGDLDNEEANRLVDVKGFAALTAAQVTAAEKSAADKNTKTEEG